MDAQRHSSFFERFLLTNVGFGMVWTRELTRKAQSIHRLPSHGAIDRVSKVRRAAPHHPTVAPTPLLALGSARALCRDSYADCLRCCSGHVGYSVAPPGESNRRVAGDRRHLFTPPPLTDEPDDVPLATRDCLFRVPITLFNFVVRQIRFEFYSSWHSPSIYQYLVLFLIVHMGLGRQKLSLHHFEIKHFATFNGGCISFYRERGL